MENAGSYECLVCSLSLDAGGAVLVDGGWWPRTNIPTSAAKGLIYNLYSLYSIYWLAECDQELSQLTLLPPHVPRFVSSPSLSGPLLLQISIVIRRPGQQANTHANDCLHYVYLWEDPHKSN